MKNSELTSNRIFLRARSSDPRPGYQKRRPRCHHRPHCRLRPKRRRRRWGRWFQIAPRFVDPTLRASRPILLLTINHTSPQNQQNSRSWKNIIAKKKLKKKLGGGGSGEGKDLWWGGLWWDRDRKYCKIFWRHCWGGRRRVLRRRSWRRGRIAAFRRRNTAWLWRRVRER